MISLSVLIEKVGDKFVAHCLELDVVATADDIDEVRRDLEELIVEQIKFAIENDNLEHLYRPAPAEYWRRFARANSPKRPAPRWARELDLSRTMTVPPLLVTSHFAYAQRKAAPATPARVS
jgi:predicted RNase H-like HicB family nuclease